MTSPRITFTLSSRTVTDPWWARLEQEDVADDTATVSDAADLLDTLYGLDACDDSTTEETEDVSAETVTETVEATVSAVSCLYDADGNVDVVVRVIRSRQDADYRLRLTGGILKTTETVRETITKKATLEDASSLTLDYPVIDGYSAEWQGSVYAKSGVITEPNITRTGNTLDFGGVDVASGTITATYLTEYDRCTVTILGVDGEPGECTARVFFHGLVDELELETPDAAEDIGSCTSHWEAPVSDDEVTCYREVTISQRCECSDHEVGRYTYEEITDCPEFITRCPGNDTECMHLLESVTVPEYVACSDDHTPSGTSRVWNVSLPEYYRDKCCKEPDGSLPQCPERTTSWRGGLPIAGGVAKYYGMYGPKLRIVPVSPPGGICGTWEIAQEVRSNNCCDGVEPLAWDTEVSPEVMTPNSAVIIGVTGGGKYPYEWSVAGSGFQFQNGSKKLTSGSSQVLLSALVGACGTATITVSDGCSTVTAQIRSTAGQWSPQLELDDTCVFGVVLGPDHGLPDTYEGIFETALIRGEYQIVQRWRQTYVEVSNTSNTCDQLRALAVASIPDALVYKSGVECLTLPGVTAIPGYSKVYERAGYCTEEGALKRYRVVINYPSYLPTSRVTASVWRWIC